jgi:SWI/SNF-related matrix-associated actin-dependent regulator of chromatin subfamily A member 5
MLKPLEEVERYSKVFFTRGPEELGDWQKIIKSVEKGESKLLEIDRLTLATKHKIARYENPWEDMPLSGNTQGKHGKLFTDEEDRILLCLVNQFGYGAWDRIKQEISEMEMFAFDYYLKSRTAVEIGRRCDVLMRICEKENVELENKEKKDAQVAETLHAQRQELDVRLQKAREELKKHQIEVDKLIMKEAKKMQQQRKRAAESKKKRAAALASDEHEVLVDRHLTKLVDYLLMATSRDAANIALDFCRDMSQDPELQQYDFQASYVLKKIRQIGVLNIKARERDVEEVGEEDEEDKEESAKRIGKVWRIRKDVVIENAPLSSTSSGSSKKIRKEEGMKDVSEKPKKKK